MPVEGASQYDLKLGVPEEQDVLGGHHLDAHTTSLLVEYALPNQTYWFQLYAMGDHVANSTWVPVSTKMTCTSHEFLSLKSSASKASHDYFSIETVRWHSPPGDGLVNRNSGTARGVAWLLATPWKPWEKCDLTLYKVHVKRVTIPGQITPKGKGGGHYANFRSCNNPAATTYRCTGIISVDCGILGVASQCGAASNDKYSKDHVGMGIVKGTGNEGRWYSTTKEGEERHNWKRESHYRTATCHRMISAAAIEKKLHMKMQKYFQPWDADVSAFGGDEEMLIASTATQGMTKEEVPKLLV